MQLIESLFFCWTRSERAVHTVTAKERQRARKKEKKRKVTKKRKRGVRLCLLHFHFHLFAFVLGRVLSLTHPTPPHRGHRSCRCPERLDVPCRRVLEHLRPVPFVVGHAEVRNGAGAEPRQQDGQQDVRVPHRDQDHERVVPEEVHAEEARVRERQHHHAHERRERTVEHRDGHLLEGEHHALLRQVAALQRVVVNALVLLVAPAPVRRLHVGLRGHEERTRDVHGRLDVDADADHDRRHRDRVQEQIRRRQSSADGRHRAADHGGLDQRDRRRHEDNRRGDKGQADGADDQGARVLHDKAVLLAEVVGKAGGKAAEARVVQEVTGLLHHGQHLVHPARVHRRVHHRRLPRRHAVLSGRVRERDVVQVRRQQAVSAQTRSRRGEGCRSDEEPVGGGDGRLHNLARRRLVCRGGAAATAPRVHVELRVTQVGDGLG
eukprot:Rhum_TRINITY_DN15412_c5_g1::Rhum_TRINITY_DN15412_c5_g1_i5::g.156524::m.156524